jgi:hypothetical protein
LRILVDTSVWIDFFRGASSQENVLFKECLRRREAIVITGTIAQEILQGVRDDSQHRSILNYLLLFPQVESGFADYLRAADIYRSLRKWGLTIRSPVDCLIAAVAMKHNTALLHRDSDFALIAQHFPLSTL